MSIYLIIFYIGLLYVNMISLFKKKERNLYLAFNNVRKLYIFLICNLFSVIIANFLEGQSKWLATLNNNC